jgi:polar amino acid transport system substrate-binding protein
MKYRIILFFLILSSWITAQETSLNLASDVWPPFTNVESKKSIALDLVSKALSRIDINTSHKIISFEEVIQGLNTKMIDGSGALWKTDDREENLIFSEPYLQNRLVLVGLKGMDVNLNSIPELTNRKIGVVKGYAYDENLLNATNLELVFGDSDQHNLESLFDRKIDYMLVDELLIQYLLQYQLNDVNTYLSIAEKPLQVKTLHLAIQKTLPNAENIIINFNKEIKKMIKDGTYNEVLNLGWVKADVDGDGIAELIFNGDYVGEEMPKKTYAVFYDEQDSSDNSEIYINGEKYSGWKDVPQSYKSKGRIQVSNDIYNPGLIIKI